MPTAKVETYNPRDRNWNNTFFIAAPAASFVLSDRPKDPLLFAYLGDERWYLIHKWGDDLSVSARIKNWVHWKAAAIVSVALLGLCGLIRGCQMVTGADERHALWGAFVIIGGVATGIIGSAVIGANWHHKRIDADNWNSPFRN